MTVSKPSDIANKWASSGTNTDPGSTKKADGWQSGEEPQFDWMNYWMNRVDQALQCLNENGAFNWDAVTAYPQDAVVWHNNNFWVSNTGTNTNNTPGATSTFWQRIRMPNITVSATMPTNGQVGNLWYNSSEKVTYVCTAAAPTNTWVPSGDSVTVGNVAPVTPSTGKLWFDTTTTVLAMKIWDGAAWVFVDHGAIAFVGTTPPSNPTEGLQWFSSALGQTFIYYNNGGTPYWVAQSPLPNSIAISEIVHLQDQKAAGTGGGTFTSGAWQTRILNTELNNDVTGASLDAGFTFFTLPAGRYAAHASVAAHMCGQHKARLRDTTNGVTLGLSPACDNDGVTDIGVPARLSCVFTLAGETDIELQHRCSNTKATDGLGKESTFDEVEVYADVFIEKISD